MAPHFRVAAVLLFLAATSVAAREDIGDPCPRNGATTTDGIRKPYFKQCTDGRWAIKREDDWSRIEGALYDRKTMVQAFSIRAKQFQRVPIDLPSKDGQPSFHGEVMPNPDVQLLTIYGWTLAWPGEHRDIAVASESWIEYGKEVVQQVDGNGRYLLKIRVSKEALRPN